VVGMRKVVGTMNSNATSLKDHCALLVSGASYIRILQTTQDAKS
jgi:hypothetical protein